MTSFILNEKLVNEEESVQRQINKHIVQGESFHFIAGAGSGKTYALVESIKFHLSTKSYSFDRTGRKIACITYTNAAKDEIIERLYENDNVSVSTIHTFLWGLVEPHQDELVLIHKKNLEKQVKDIEFSLHCDDVNGAKPAYKKFRSLESEQDKLIKIINDDHSCFYQILQSTVASDFWSKLEEKLGNELYLSIKSKVQDVERIIRDIIKISKYRKCIDNITDKKDGYSTVKYNEFGGREVLHKNEIGHDTLINYVGAMINEYDILCKIIIDTFPAIYIDEYQDTHEEVIRVLEKILKYSEEYEIEFLVALFGDPVQSIYSNNLSCQSLNGEIKLVSKNINRRSHNNVIDLI
ncbi:UvrD-helicase domain-containing protein, partial [Vibrio splendidus]|uniref:UvrD-helicase domain-containing protein n=1 Tax=Vibrio splendidus TaxID=29497 RepID=UPI001055CA51